MSEETKEDIVREMLVQEQPDNMTQRPNLLAANIATAVLVIILLLAFWSRSCNEGGGAE